LKRRKSLGSTTIAGGATGCSLSPGGTRLLIVAQVGFHDRKSRLDLWNISGGKALEMATWWPYATSDTWQDEITWADWINEELLLTFNREGMLVLWRLEGSKPVAVYQIDGQPGSMPALSPGRKHLALATPRGVEIFRSLDGELLARMDELNPTFGSLAFSENGGQLACAAGKGIYVWDTATGKLQRDFDCNELNGGTVTWLSAQHLLVGGTDVVDVSKRLILWHYESKSRLGIPLGDWYWMVMQSGDLLGIVPAKLLPKEVLAAGKKFENMDADEMLVLRPGAKVSLDLQLGGEEQTKAEQALRAELERNGMEIVPDQPLRFSARIVTGQSNTEEYRGMSIFDRTTEQVTVSQKLYEVELTLEGQQIWKQSTTYEFGQAPMIIHMQEGETAQQVVDRENAQRSKHFAFGMSLPRYVVHPKYAGPLGTSKLTPGGP
jgi:hypothetical protein